MGNPASSLTSGEYAINADGTFTGSLSLSAACQYGLTGVIDNGANEVQFVYSANNADITACSAKRAIVTANRCCTGLLVCLPRFLRHHQHSLRTACSPARS